MTALIALLGPVWSYLVSGLGVVLGGLWAYLWARALLTVEFYVHS